MYREDIHLLFIILLTIAALSFQTSVYAEVLFISTMLQAQTSGHLAFFPTQRCNYKASKLLVDKT